MIVDKSDRYEPSKLGFSLLLLGRRKLYILTITVVERRGAGCRTVKEPPGKDKSDLTSQTFCNHQKCVDFNKNTKDILD